MAQQEVRQYEARARSTEVFGRVLCNARNQHFVVDGPVQNGCPGEALTPPEIFLSGVASCGVELLQVLARQQNVPLRSVEVQISGTIDRSRPVRPDVTVFNGVRLPFQLAGFIRELAAALVDGLQGR